MEHLVFVFLSIILIVLGVILLIAELESEEVELFGPAAIICFIVGLTLWFLSNPISWLISAELSLTITIILISIIIILSSFIALITYKIIKAKKNPPSLLKFEGGFGKTIDKIGSGKEGYILYHGEYWKARSDKIIMPGQKVKILKKEGLTLLVEAENGTSEEILSEEKLFCHSCGAKLFFDSKICSYCGTQVRN